MVDRRTFGRILGTGAVAALGGLAAPATASRAASRATVPAPGAPPGRGGRLGATVPDAETRAQPEFGPVRQIDADELNVGYVETGPADGRPVFLLHGWPYDIHSYVAVAPLLAAQGYRAITPHLRGHGTTRFRDGAAPRTAEQSAFALDLVALMDALGVRRAVLAGYDWGSRTADIVAALWPERVKALVSVTGYLITNREANKQPLPPKAEWAWWYQYYFSTERGRLGLDENRHDLAKLIWTFNSPTWKFDDATFDRTAASFDNPDYVPIVIGNYRWRLGLAEGDPRHDDLEAQLAKGPPIAVPTITVDGEVDPFTPPGDGAAYRARFTGPYQHRTLQGIGHNVPQEAPEPFAQAVMDADQLK
ncbi:alpha/beta fold hydrolase [Catellatospora coxensis]|uniref:Alpha/beta hydrolase n=1 Tax=Catellatospora coxensis TaxID=310354 RepID=A0A8J3KXE8_9ACTN|nr:alpha/beta hydrolase [Catellatospora coxensis]GIG10448.1 alpha/beta hydrolase [Catellatospora coxensis]